MLMAQIVLAPPRMGLKDALIQPLLSEKVPPRCAPPSMSVNDSNTQPTRRPRRIVWENVLTVVSAAILISAEVFGAAFAGSWAIANLLALGSVGARALDGLFVVCGIVVMVQFVRAARRIEPFTAD